MSEYQYLNELDSLLHNNLVSKGYEITSAIELDPYPQNSKYEALVFAINGKKVIYRKGNTTSDRPGNFLSIWKRPDEDSLEERRTKPYDENDIDYLFVKVDDGELTNRGMYIFPASILIAKGILYSDRYKGKMALRVFPPWTSSRGDTKSKIFSDSAKKTQLWQNKYFVRIDNNLILDFERFADLFV